MPLPQSQKLKSALLKLLSDRKTHTTSALTYTLAKEFRVKSTERKKLDSAVEKALADFKRGGLIDSEKKNSQKISVLGLEVLKKSEGQEEMKEEEALVREN